MPDPSGAPEPGARDATTEDDLEVSVDQDLCTGDGLCVQYAPDVFELDVDGLAYVKGPDQALQMEPGAHVPVPVDLVLAVVDSARECPGECIHVRRRSDGVEVAGPLADTTGASAAG
ncbi:MAG: ferredoxin [Actinomycetes bacterium]